MRAALSARRPGAEALVAVALTLAFVVITAVWLAFDDRVPDFDNGRHLLRAFEFRDRLAEWELLDPYTAEGDYPPLVALVGAVGALVGGVAASPPILAINLFFVPLYALGLYGAGRKAFGPRAGALAVAFGLAVPMIISQFHVSLVDAPLAAMAGVSVWLLLESERFGRARWALLAGLAVAGGMLVKQTFPFFVAGLLAVMVLRGGWRHWRGIVLFALPPLLLAVPWYLERWTDFEESTRGATGATPAASYVEPVRWSVNDFTWYAWNFLNVQVLAPLALLFAIGVVWAAWRWLSRREPESLAPELIAGFVVSYIGITYLTLHDPRYSIGFLVYVAVLGTGWIARLRGRGFWLGAGVVGLILVVNTLAVNLRIGDPVRADIWTGAHHAGVHDRRVTLYSPLGYPVNEPLEDEVLEVMRVAKRDGITTMEFDPAHPVPGFNGPGLGALGRIAGLDRPEVYDPSKLSSDAIFYFRRPVGPADPEPCAWTTDGPRDGVYVTRGSPLVNGGGFPQPNLYCPPR